MPEISVIIPTYNYANYIKETIESVIAQTFKGFEIIVVDDGSTDETKAVLETYIKKNIVKYIYQANQGLAAARNAGIKNSQGRLITFLDSDDLFTKDKLQVLREVLINNPSIGMAYGNHLIWTGTKLYKKPKFSSGQAPSGWILPQLFKTPLMSADSVLIRRECFKQVGLFDERLTSGEDWEMWLRLAKVYKIKYVDKIVAFVRVHPKSMSTNFIRMGENKLQIQKSAYFNFQTQLLQAYSQNEIDKIFGLTYIDLAKHQLIQGTPRAARMHLKCVYGLNRKSFLKNGWLWPATYFQSLIIFLFKIKMKILNKHLIADKPLSS